MTVQRTLKTTEHSLGQSQACAACKGCDGQQNNIPMAWRKGDCALRWSLGLNPQFQLTLEAL